tara:strand:- start:14 stop:292 length:279 start_codon:yes stop_codon:yes gene_type:complete
MIHHRKLIAAVKSFLKIDAMGGKYKVITLTQVFPPYVVTKRYFYRFFFAVNVSNNDMFPGKCFGLSGTNAPNSEIDKWRLSGSITIPSGLLN